MVRGITKLSFAVLFSAFIVPAQAVEVYCQWRFRIGTDRLDRIHHRARYDLANSGLFGWDTRPRCGQILQRIRIRCIERVGPERGS